MSSFVFFLVQPLSPTENENSFVDVCGIVLFFGITLDSNVTVTVSTADGPLAGTLSFLYGAMAINVQNSIIECFFLLIINLVAGEDYTLPNPLEYFFDTSTNIGDSRCLRFGILNDNNFEGDHNFRVSVFQTVPDGIVVPIDTLVVTIKDDDGLLPDVILCL